MRSSVWRTGNIIHAVGRLLGWLGCFNVWGARALRDARVEVHWIVLQEGSHWGVRVGWLFSRQGDLILVGLVEGGRLASLFCRLLAMCYNYVPY